MAEAKYGSLPFDEAIKFFRRKLNVPTQAWTDIWQHQHDVGFVIAGATQAELLQDMRDAVDKFKAQGTTLAEFRKDFDAIVNRYGWGYNGGRNWRTKVIYQTNMRTANQAGRYQQLKRGTRLHPYWRYKHSDAVEHPRPEHEAWDGLVLRHDDPFWDTHYPPNGWGCQCRVFGVSERQLKKMGKTEPDAAPSIEWEQKTVGIRGPSPRTVNTPKGIDPGWAYAPGAQYAELLAQASTKAGSLDYQLGAAYIEALVGSETFNRWLGRPTGFFPVARLPDDQAQQIGATARYAALSAETAGKQIERHPELSGAEYQAIQSAVEKGERIQEGRSFVYILDEPDGYVTVIKSTLSGKALFLQSLRRLSRDEAKRDEEILRLRARKK